MSEHDIVILEGVSVGTDPMVGSFLVHAVIEESSRLLSRLSGGIVSVTVALRTLTIRVRLNDTLSPMQLVTDLRNIKALFSEVASAAYKKTTQG